MKRGEVVLHEGKNVRLLVSDEKRKVELCMEEAQAILLLGQTFDGLRSKKIRHSAELLSGAFDVIGVEVLDEQVPVLGGGSVLVLHVYDRESSLCVPLEKHIVDHLHLPGGQTALGPLLDEEVGDHQHRRLQQRNVVVLQGLEE